MKNGCVKCGLETANASVCAQCLEAAAFAPSVGIKVGDHVKSKAVERLQRIEPSPRARDVDLVHWDSEGRCIHCRKVGTPGYRCGCLPATRENAGTAPLVCERCKASPESRFGKLLCALDVGHDGAHRVSVIVSDAGGEEQTWEWDVHMGPVRCTVRTPSDPRQAYTRAVAMQHHCARDACVVCGATGCTDARCDRMKMTRAAGGLTVQSWEDFVVAKTALAASEKERERLKGELDGNGKYTVKAHGAKLLGCAWFCCGETWGISSTSTFVEGDKLSAVGYARVAVCHKCRTLHVGALVATREGAEDCSPLRRELENLKRSTSSELADQRATSKRYLACIDEQRVEIAFLKRELDRERSKSKKRGL